MDMLKDRFVHGHIPRAGGWGSVKESPIHGVFRLQVERFERSDVFVMDVFYPCKMLLKNWIGRIVGTAREMSISRNTP